MILTTIWLLVAFCGNVCMHIDCLTDCLMPQMQLPFPQIALSQYPRRIATCNSSASCSSCCDTIPTISSSCDASSSDRRASYHWCPRNASNRSTGSNNYYNGSLWSRNLRNGGFRWKFCGMRHMRNLWILYRTLLCAKDKKLTTEGVVNLLRH